MSKTDAQISTEITNIKTLITSDAKIDGPELQRILNSLNDNKINNDKVGTYKYSLSATANFSQVIPADRLILVITITNNVGLTNLKVGTSAGNDNIIPDQMFVGKGTFNISLHHDASVTLYFSGITSATTAKIYTQ